MYEEFKFKNEGQIHGEKINKISIDGVTFYTGLHGLKAYVFNLQVEEFFPVEAEISHIIGYSNQNLIVSFMIFFHNFEFYQNFMLSELG